MKVVATLAAASLFCLSVDAQVTPITSPPGHLSMEGSKSSNHFGGYKSWRLQIFDGNWRGKGFKILTEVGYRIDYRNHTTISGSGRSWGNVTLAMSEGRHDGPIFPAWSANSLTTPTTVFSGSVTWPTLTGFPNGRPAPNPWGKEVLFPFSSQWVFSGGNDFLLDYTFAGGVLANNAAWDGLVDYRLDAAPADVDNSWYRALGTLNCVDSWQTVGARSYVAAETYAKQAFNPNFDDKLSVFTQSIYTGGGQPVMHVLGVNGISTSFPGVTCNKIEVDLALPIVIFRGIADVNGRWHNRFATVPWNVAFTSIQLFGQAAWSDSVTGQLMLARGGRASVRGQPLGLFRTLHQTTTGVAVAARHVRIPLARYTLK